MNVQSPVGGLGQRLPRVFQFETQLILCIQGPATVCIARDKAGAEAGINAFLNSGAIQDGFIANSTTTSSPTAQPFVFVWSGELWYATDQNNAQFSLVIATETSQRN